MELKRLLIILGIALTIMFGLLLGVSYAWYAYSNAETSAKGSTIKETPTIIFAQTDRIISSQNMPIADDDRYVYATKNSFIVTLGSNLKDYQTAIEISLTNIKISDELKSVNYKYELLENGVTIVTGNFSNIGNMTTLSLKPLTIMNHTKDEETYTYDLYIWLSDDGTNQNELMNKSFGAKVNVKSAVKK